jgi:Uma2 family endonuclease
MSEAKRHTSWTWEAYLDWEAGQPIRYELVDRQILAMGGGTAEHNTIGNNLRAALHFPVARQTMPAARPGP